MSFLSDLPVYFVRHNMDSSPTEYKKLLDENIIAFHYAGEIKEGVSKDTILPEDFLRKKNLQGVHILNRLYKLCHTGVIITADYSDKDHLQKLPPSMIIGYIEKNSDPKKVIIPREFKPSNIEDYYPETSSYYRTVRLIKPVKISYSEFGVLQGLLAHRMGNLSHYTSDTVSEFIKNVYRFKLKIIDEIPDSVVQYTPVQLEVLCSEYLRSHAPNEIRIDYFLTPIGRGRQDIDIDAVKKDTIVLGQVSHSDSDKIVRNKIKRLISYTSENDKNIIYVYFGPEKMISIANEYPDLKYITIENVHHSMKETGIVSHMLPWRK